MDRHTTPDRSCTRRHILGGAALLAGGALLGAGGVAPAAWAEEDEPRLYLRADWGARSPRSTPQVLSTPPDHIVVHHTATGNTSATSKSHAFSLSRGIQNWHMDNNGWWDAGQHLTISRGGHIMEGRHGSVKAIRGKKHVVGAHTANHNSHTVGIENEGTYTSAKPPEALMSALVDTLAWLCAVYGLNPQTAIVGHRDYNATACPGDRLYALLPRLRDDVDREAERRESLLDQVVDIPTGHLPTYPEPPRDERVTQYYHGPALGRWDPVS